MTLTPTSNKAIYAAEWKEFHVYSVNKDDKWTEHCKGLIKVDFIDDKDPNKVNADLPLSAFTQLKAHDSQHGCSVTDSPLGVALQTEVKSFSPALPELVKPV